MVALLETDLNEEQKDVLMQTIYYVSQDYHIVDLKILWHHYPEKG